MNPLVKRIIEARDALADLESAKRPDRNRIMRDSIHLGGLEEAAQLVLGPDDFAILLHHLRTGEIPA